jgi:chemotaxis protein histidine kinase CheA
MADATPDISTEETEADVTEEMAEAAEAVAAENSTDAAAPETEEATTDAGAAPDEAPATDAAAPETEEATADAGAAPDEAPATEGKFASAAAPETSVPDAVQSVPEETQQQYQAVAAKGNSLKLAGEQVLSSGSKEELKQSLPVAIVLKKNMSKDVGQLYEQYKNFKSANDNPETIEQFKEACNTVIRDAQKMHQEIKEKVYTVYEKTPPS